jgi:M6 family metalloprotease-like protein
MLEQSRRRREGKSAAPEAPHWCIRVMRAGRLAPYCEGQAASRGRSSRGSVIRRNPMRLNARWAIPLLVALALAGCATAGDGGGASALRAQHALGVRRLLVLGVSFPGIEPGRSLAQLREHVLERSADYYATQSWGKTTLVGDVKGWYRLPRPLDDYKVSPHNVEVDRRRVRLLVEDALTAAEKDTVFSRYDHIAITVGVETRPGVGYGMIAYAANPGMLSANIRRGQVRMWEIQTRGGQRFGGGIVVVAQNAHTGHIVHDLAHALGGVVGGKRPIPDLYDTVLQGKIGPLTPEAYPKYTVFMGPWDVMSRHFVGRAQPVPGMSSFTRLRMGWIGNDQVVEVPPGQTRTAALAPLAAGRGTLAVRIPGRSGTHHLLEYRQRLPGDPVPPSTGLLVLRVDEGQEDGDGVVRVVDANPRVPDFGAATFGLGPGQPRSAELGPDTTVEVVSQRDAELVVRVSRR